MVIAIEIPIWRWSLTNSFRPQYWSNLYQWLTNNVNKARYKNEAISEITKTNTRPPEALNPICTIELASLRYKFRPKRVYAQHPRRHLSWHWTWPQLIKCRCHVRNIQKIKRKRWFRANYRRCCMILFFTGSFNTYRANLSVVLFWYSNFRSLFNPCCVLFRLWTALSVHTTSTLARVFYMVLIYFLVGIFTLIYHRISDAFRLFIL